MSKIIFPLSKDYNSEDSLEPKVAQVQTNPAAAQIKQALDLLKAVASKMDLSGQDPNQPFLRVGRAIQELEEALKRM